MGSGYFKILVLDGEWLRYSSIGKELRNVESSVVGSKDFPERSSED